MVARIYTGTMAVVLVTGATGYIGGRLVPELLAAGHRVRCLVRNPLESATPEWHGRVDVVEGDITDRRRSTGAMAGVEVALPGALHGRFRGLRPPPTGGRRLVP